MNGCFTLVVDDDAVILQSLVLLLEVWGCEVVSASSLREVEEKMRGLPKPEAVLVDYRLRDSETGLMVLDRLRQMYGEEVPALVITGDTAPAIIRQIAEIGVPILHKPVAPGALEEYVRRLCTCGNGKA